MPLDQRVDYTGLARSHHHQAISTRVHDVGLTLHILENSKDGYEHGATDFNYTIRPDTTPGRGVITYRDNGDGKADALRMTTPAPNNGSTEASRYAAGKTQTRCYLDNNTFAFTIAYKQVGWDGAAGFTGPYSQFGMVQKDWRSLPAEGTPYRTREEHGYYEEMGVMEERMPRVADLSRKVKKAKKGETAKKPTFLDAMSCQNWIDHSKEITRVRFPQEMLNKTTTHFKATDIGGKVIEGIVPKGAKTLLTVLRESPHVTHFPGNKFEFPTFTATVECFMLDLESKRIIKDKDIIRDFPHYAKGGFALAALCGQVVWDMPIYEMFDLAQHPASQNWRIVYVNFEHNDGDTDINLLPTPASVKIKFTGELYNLFLKEFRKWRPEGFLKWKKASSESGSTHDTQSVAVTEDYENEQEAEVPVVDDAPVPVPVAVPAPVPVPDRVPDPVPAPVIEEDNAHPPAPAPVEDEDVEDAPPQHQPLSVTGLPGWISKLVGQESNLKHYTTEGRLQFQYDRSITDPDQNALTLALAVAEWCVTNEVSVADIDIVWSVSRARHVNVTDSIERYKNIMPILARVNVVAKN